MQDKGFSLIELIVTLSVVVILVTVGVPTLCGMLENNRLRSASEELYQRLYYAKSIAINNQQNIYFPFTTGTSWCYGTNPEATCDCTNPVSCNLGTVSTPNNQVSLTITGFNSGEARIQSGRGMFLQSGNATFSLNGKSIQVKASKMGRITICSDTIAGYKPC